MNDASVVACADRPSLFVRGRQIGQLGGIASVAAGHDGR